MATCNLSAANSCDKSCVYNFYETAKCVFKCFYKACNASIHCQDQSTCFLQTECYSKTIPLRNFLDVCSKANASMQSIFGSCGTDSFLKIKLWMESKEALCQLIQSPTRVAKCWCKECWWWAITNCGDGPWFYCSCEAHHMSTTTEIPTTPDHVTSAMTTEITNKTILASMTSDNSDASAVIGGAVGGVIAVLLLLALSILLLLWFRKIRTKNDKKTNVSSIDNITYEQQVRTADDMHYEEVVMAPHAEVVTYNALVDTHQPNDYDQPRENTYEKLPEKSNEQPSTEHYEQPRTEHYEQPQTEQYQQPPTEHYEQPQTEQYQQPPTEHYEQPQTEHYEQQRTEHKEQSQIEHYEQPQTEHFEQQREDNSVALDWDAIKTPRNESEVDRKASGPVYENEVDVPQRHSTNRDESNITSENAANRTEEGSYKTIACNDVQYLNVENDEDSPKLTDQDGYIEFRQPLDKQKKFTNSDNYDHLDRHIRGHDDSEGHYDHLN